jgi:hypothetical protein
MAKLYGTLTFALLLGLAGSVWAVDGVVDINQARALAGGVSPGDTAGFPVTVSQAGSYRLTGNLTVPDANTTAISVAADNVTVDLNGFSILGPTVCTGSPVTACAPAGSGDGVSVSAGERVAVFNGAVQGVGRDGVAVGLRSRVEHVRASSNGDEGIQTGDGCTVSGNTTAHNGGNGITAARSTVGGNVTEGNRQDGIVCLGGCTMTGNTATSNGSCGIHDFASSTVIGNTATLNAGFGMCFDDGGNSRAGYVNNVLNDNNGGNANPQLFGGVEMGSNICGGAALCP